MATEVAPWQDDDVLEVVGESHYAQALEDLHVRVGRYFIATLRREPTNRFDSNAVIVLGPSGLTLGYLPREEAEVYNFPLELLENRGIPATCAAKILGGTADKPNRGVLLRRGDIFAAKPEERGRDNSRGAHAVIRRLGTLIDVAVARSGVVAAWALLAISVAALLVGLVVAWG